ncbi:hypothetical protein BDV12DRAFT_175597 [Aspergillus spectabilis]
MPKKDLIGALVWPSPEAHLGSGWGTPTDVWAFGALLATFLYGEDFVIFRPDVPVDHEEYETRIVAKQCEFFGPFPLTYQDLCPQETLGILTYIMQSIPAER